MSDDARQPQFEEIVALIGEAAALRLCQDFGGQRRYLAQPENLTPRNPFAVALGLPAARLLAARWGGNYIEPPLGPNANAARQARLIERLIREGKTNNAIAQQLRCTRRTVQAHRRRLDEARQPDLFSAGRAA